MVVMFVLLPVALLFSAAAVAVFVWATRTGQFDDLETPGLRILDEDARPLPRPAAGDPRGSARVLDAPRDPW
jgi:cbb3-type cytochrome oxidase maturation protein